MGMAASQARYLALTARKTNTEYEGQQINQARTALANQSANLFNCLLNMEVPNPPKTSDYTTLQYSYSDGENESVIDSWTQLSGVNPDYNYLVNSHYIASMYTGAIRQLTDPQVQINGNGTAITDWNTLALSRGLVDTADSVQQARNADYQRTKTTEESHILDVQTLAQQNNANYSNISSGIINITPTTPNALTYTLTDSDGNTYSVSTSDSSTILQGVRDMLDTNLITLSTLNNYLADSGILLQESDIPKIPDEISDEQKNAILSAFAIETDDNSGAEVKRIVAMRDIQSIINDPLIGTTNHEHSLSGTFLSSDDSTQSLHDLATDISEHQSIIDTAQQNYRTAYENYQNQLNAYNALTKPTYIGNSELTPLFELTDDQKTELLQVVKDMKAENIDTDIINCFDTGDNYLGGVYSFKMNGTTYYTTQQNLEEAYYNSYPQNGSNNIIDGQYKMPYYNASYIDKRIEKESYALLETDGNGRFKTVKFDNDSVVYSLNTETVTDEAAYEDAMNKYLYEKEKYEKTIADINAKTSIIQKEDRTLELRLKQLDTEQNALKTEMDAVKKVIKDNVESTFKTFSD